MANVQKSSGKAVVDPQAGERLKSYYHTASLKMTPEPYAESHRAIFSVSRIYPMFYHPSSILLGCGFIWLFISFSGFEDVSSFTWIEWLMAGLTSFMILIVLVGLEIGKSALSSVVFKASALEWKQSTWHVVCLVVLMLASIGISSMGGAHMTMKWSDKTPQLNKVHLAELDSIQQFYDEEIAKVDSTRRLYFEQNSWLGKLDHSARKQYNAYEQEAQALKNEKREALEYHHATHIKESQDARSATAQFGFIAAAFIFVLEVFSLVAYRYQWIYLSVVYREGIRLEYLDETQQDSPSKNDLLITSLTRILDYFGDSPIPHVSQSKSVPDSLQIGFQYGSQYSNNEEARRRADYLKKWDFVVEDLESGLAISEILKKHQGRVSRSTVKNIKRCLDN